MTRISSPLRHSMALGGGPPRGPLTPPHHRPLSPPSFSGLDRESSSSVGNTNLDSRLLARMTTGRVRVIPAVSFCCRHSRALIGNPGHHSLCRAFFFAVILGASPGIQALPSHPLPPPSFSSLARESRPSFSVPCVFFAVILGASPGIQALPSHPLPPPSFSSLDRESSSSVGNTSLDSRLLARMTTGKDGENDGRGRTVRMTDGKSNGTTMRTVSSTGIRHGTIGSRCMTLCSQSLILL